MIKYARVRWILLIACLLCLALQGLSTGAAQAPPVEDYVILVDTTGSMVGHGDSIGDIWDEVLGYILDTVETLPKNGRVAIIPFDTGPRLDRAYPAAEGEWVPPASLTKAEREAIEEHLRQLPVDGQNTWIYESLEYAIDLLHHWQGQEPDRRHLQRIFLYTDGRDNGPHRELGVEGIVELFRAAHTDMPYLYTVYRDLGDNLTAQEKQRIEEVEGMDVVERVTYHVNVRENLLDLGVLGVDRKKVTVQVDLASEYEGVWGSPVQMTLQGAEGLALVETEQRLVPEMPLEVEVVASELVPGEGDGRLVFQSQAGDIVIDPASVRVVYSVPTPTPTMTPTSTSTPSLTPSATSTASPTPTATAAPTATPTPTPALGRLTVRWGGVEGTDRKALGRPENGEYVTHTLACRLEWDKGDPPAEVRVRPQLPDSELGQKLSEARLWVDAGDGPKREAVLSSDDEAVVVGLALPEAAWDQFGPGRHVMTFPVSLEPSGVVLSESGDVEKGALMMRVALQNPWPVWPFFGVGVIVFAALVWATRPRWPEGLMLEAVGQEYALQDLHPQSFWTGAITLGGGGGAAFSFGVEEDPCVTIRPGFAGSWLGQFTGSRLSSYRARPQSGWKIELPADISVESGEERSMGVGQSFEIVRDNKHYDVQILRQEEDQDDLPSDEGFVDF